MNKILEKTNKNENYKDYRRVGEPVVDRQDQK